MLTRNICFVHSLKFDTCTMKSIVIDLKEFYVKLDILGNIRHIEHQHILYIQVNFINNKKYNCCLMTAKKIEYKFESKSISHKGKIQYIHQVFDYVRSDQKTSCFFHLLTFLMISGFMFCTIAVVGLVGRKDFAVPRHQPLRESQILLRNQLHCNWILMK